MYIHSTCSEAHRLASNPNQPKVASRSAITTYSTGEEVGYASHICPRAFGLDPGPRPSFGGELGFPNFG